MSENNSSISVTKDDMSRDISLLYGASTTVLRIEYDKMKRQLAIYQRQLDPLMADMQTVKAKIYANYDLSTLDEQFRPDRNMSTVPVQSYAAADTPVNGAHQSVSYDRDQMERRTPGLRELKNELDRINEQYKLLQDKIRTCTNRIKIIDAQIASNEQRKDGITSADMSANAIQQSRKTTLLFLYQIHVLYKKLTTDPTDKTGERRAYPTNDVKLTKDLMRYQQTFRAHALSFPELLSDPDPAKKLDLIDPGASINEIILSRQVAITQTASKDSKVVDANVTKYVTSLQTTLQDPLNSRGILRSSDPVIPSANAMSAYNTTYPVAMVNLFGATYHSAWTFPNIYKSVSDWWRKKVSQNYQGLPPCKTPELSDSDKAVAADKVKQDVADAAGEAVVVEKTQKATAAVTKPPKTLDEIKDLLNAEITQVKKVREYIVTATSTAIVSQKGGIDYTINGVHYTALLVSEESLYGSASSLEASLNGLIVKGSATSEQKDSILSDVGFPSA